MQTAELNRIVEALVHQKDLWAALPAGERFHHLMELRTRVGEAAERWVEAAAAAKGIAMDSPAASEEWTTGPWALLHAINRYLRTLQAIHYGEDILSLAGHTRVRTGGQVIVEVAPLNIYESLLFNGVSAEVWMEEEVTLENLREHVGSHYRALPVAGKVALVLGAGNLAAIAPLDVLHKLVGESQVCVLKLNPVNDYLGPIFEEIFASMILYGFVRIVYGDAAVGKALVEHPQIDEIHITGGAATHDAIVFGAGDKGAPALHKRVTSELGNVTPTIVVPGPWSEADLAFQAENIVTQKMHNCGFNCVATQILVTPSAWEQTPRLMGAVRSVMRTLPVRPSYYPGAHERQQAVTGAYARVELPGTGQAEGAQRTLITKLDADDGACELFSREVFGPVLAQTGLPGDDAAAFLYNAVEFCNTRLSGTLGANIIIHPKTRRRLGAQFEDALAALRYGAIGVNAWVGVNFMLSQTAWGAFPGHTLDDIQSGVGKVHNTFLFDRAQKSVVYAPFSPFPRGLWQGEWHSLPKPPWFLTNKSAHVTARRLTNFELNPGVRHLPGILAAALRG